MQLFVPKTEQQDATIPIRWCLDPDERTTLENNKIKKSFVLIVVSQQGKELQRRLVPLFDDMCYLAFRRAGDLQLHGQLVFHTNDPEATKRYYLSWNQNRELKYAVLDREGKLFDDTWEEVEAGHVKSLPGTSLDVSVPTEHFAKEPPQWLGRWVNWWFSHPPRDQCAYRKRLILALTIKPLAMLIWIPLIMLVRLLICGTLTILGDRQINWQPVVHPFRHATDDIYSGVDKHSRWFWKKGNVEPRAVFFWGCNPIFGLLSLSLVSLMNAVEGWELTILQLLFWSAIATIGWGVVLHFMSWGILLIDRFVLPVRYHGGPRKAWVLYLQEMDEQYKLDARRLYASNMDLVSCPNAALEGSGGSSEPEELYLPPDVNLLPKSKRGFRLRFARRKSRACRPFAQK